MLSRIPDPFQTPSWRWELARQLFESKQRFNRRGYDAATMEAYRFLVAEATGTTEVKKHFNAKKFPGIYQARRIHQHDTFSVKWGIQARLLAREDIRQIARKHYTTAETVSWYARLFYDVSDALDSPDYILNVVIGESIHRGINARDYDLLWKMYGFFGGPILLDSLVHTFTNPQFVTHKDQIDKAWSVDHRSTAFRKAAIAIRTIPVAFNEHTIIETHHHLLEIEKSGDNAAAGAEALLYAHIKATCDSVSQFLQPASTRSSGAIEYDKQGIEPRAVEMSAQDVGVVVDQSLLVDMAEQAKERKFSQ